MDLNATLNDTATEEKAKTKVTEYNVTDEILLIARKVYENGTHVEHFETVFKAIVKAIYPDAS